ncbi:MAG: tRNA-dihydrouridine synthase family protein [Victivallales bacterium]|jgi:tRNA-dihydrouridine synthase B|nr:tRNA-dihydrouridine synthase family protein [Victivallales bacterium]
MKSFPYPEDALLLAPLSGYTDLPYRRAARRCACSYAFTEMVDAAALAYARKRSESLLLRGEDEGFLGVQLVGANCEHLKIALDVLNEYDFDILDFNLGCPVPKVAKKGAGAELGRHIDRALECFSLFRERSRHRLSAKIRIIDATDSAPTLELARGLAELGVEAITIHGRVKEAFYSGPVAFEQIRQVREALVDVQIIANGGVTNQAKYDEIRRETGCKAVMLARGAMGNPWLFREISEGEAYSPPTFAEWLEVMQEHIEGMIALYGEESAMCISRKILHDYFKGRGFRGELRDKISFLQNRADFNEFLGLIPIKDDVSRKTV